LLRVLDTKQIRNKQEDNTEQTPYSGGYSKQRVTVLKAFCSRYLSILSELCFDFNQGKKPEIKLEILSKNTRNALLLLILYMKSHQKIQLF
jgi:hypothetical protein